MEENIFPATLDAKALEGDKRTTMCHKLIKKPAPEKYFLTSRKAFRGLGDPTRRASGLATPSGFWRPTPFWSGVWPSQSTSPPGETWRPPPHANEEKKRHFVPPYEKAEISHHPLTPMRIKKGASYAPPRPLMAASFIAPLRGVPHLILEGG